uniref:Uncharacterized protein n=2 Tax=Electrophorus electricus TaxID=8005 RepID=A0AAY5EFN9_ELEEL
MQQIMAVPLAGTSIEQISSSINTGRNGSIQINNQSAIYTLKHPRVFTSSGYPLSPPPPTIARNSIGACTFTKTSSSFRGSVGVLTYQILDIEAHTPGKLVIMFSVPFDYNMYENWFALGIFEENITCDQDLFRQMYYEKGSFTRSKGTGNEISYSQKNLQVKGTMSPAGKSIMKVEFEDQ